MKMSKRQVPLEYLMTYGIVIAIVVIAVAALYSMGVFDVSNTTSDEEIQKEMCFTLCNNIGEDFNYYGVGYNEGLKDWSCYCSRTYIVAGINETDYKITVVNNYGTLLDVVKIENESE